MYRGNSKQFKVVRSREASYAVWHADAAVTGMWREVGVEGTADACWEFVDRRELDEVGYLVRLAAVAA